MVKRKLFCSRVSVFMTILVLSALCLYVTSKQAWAASLAAPTSPSNAHNNPMQQCLGLADQERLACYDQLAMQTPLEEGAIVSTPHTPMGDLAVNPWDAALQEAPADTAGLTQTSEEDLDNNATAATPPVLTAKPSIMEDMWELRAETQDSLFALQPYRTSYVLFAQYADRVNRQPTSPSQGRVTSTETDYSDTEAKFQLSVKSKLGHNLLFKNDSLWFGYTQISQWQIYSGDISRPFRATSYMPEVFYVMPIQQKIPGTAWTWRLASVGLIHESNGQSNPLSRSWNRAYIGLGLDSPTMSIYARVWKRLPEGKSSDDNPPITHFVGRADILFNWDLGKDNGLEFKFATNLRRDNKGSVQAGYYFPLSRLWGMGNHLRGYIQVFHGYGETITDYNFRRSTIGFGVALKEW